LVCLPLEEKKPGCTKEQIPLDEVPAPVSYCAAPKDETPLTRAGQNKFPVSSFC
jgi:hypothetical protein